MTIEQLSRAKELQSIIASTKSATRLLNAEHCDFDDAKWLGLSIFSLNKDTDLNLIDALEKIKDQAESEFNLL